MNLRRVSPEEKVNICRKYFLAGIPLLPWVWIINVLWFWREATKVDHIPQVYYILLKYAISCSIFGVLYVINRVDLDI